MKTFSILLVLLLAAVPARAEITLGLIGPLSGQYAVNGEQLRRGGVQAVADINKAGGVLGQKLKMEILDDACDPKQAVAAANRMAARGIRFIVGHYCSGSAIPSSKVMMDEGAVMVSPGSTNPRLTDEGGPGIFRVCGRDDRQGVVVADAIAKEFPGEKIALLHDKSAYGRGLADEVRKNLNARGIKETLFEAYTPGEKDYSALVTLLKQNNIGVAFIGGYHTEGGLIARQLRAAGSKAWLFGGDAFVTSEFAAIAGPAAEGMMMTFGPDPRNRKEAQTAVRSFRARGYEPEGYTLYAYAAAQVLAGAIQKAGAADPAKAIPVMHRETFHTVMGPIAFDEKGDVKSPAYMLYQWKNGKYAERDPAPPKNQAPAATGGRVICTMDMKICPGGTAVGRTGPDCAFKPCPERGK